MEPTETEVKMNRLAVVAQPRKRKAQMKRSDWYMVFTLLVFANAATFDKSYLGLVLMLVAVLIVVLVDGFGVQL